MRELNLSEVASVNGAFSQEEISTVLTSTLQFSALGAMSATIGQGVAMIGMGIMVGAAVGAVYGAVTVLGENYNIL